MSIELEIQLVALVVAVACALPGVFLFLLFSAACCFLNQFFARLALCLHADVAISCFNVCHET